MGEESEIEELMSPISEELWIQVHRQPYDSLEGEHSRLAMTALNNLSIMGPILGWRREGGDLAQSESVSSAMELIKPAHRGLGSGGEGPLDTVIDTLFPPLGRLYVKTEKGDPYTRDEVRDILQPVYDVLNPTSEIGQFYRRALQDLVEALAMEPLEERVTALEQQWERGGDPSQTKDEPPQR